MKEIKMIMVAIDLSVMAEEALKRAIEIAKRHHSHLLVLHVIEAPFFASLAHRSPDKVKIEKRISQTVEKLNSDDDVKYTILIKDGVPSKTILLQSAENKIDLLVVGTNSKDDVESEYFGSTALKLVKKSHIPLLIVKNESNTAYQKMMIPTNMSDRSKKSIVFVDTLFERLPRKYLFAAATMSEIQAMVYRIGEEEFEALRREMALRAKAELKAFVTEVGGGEMHLIDALSSVKEDLLDDIIEDTADLLILDSKGADEQSSFVFGSIGSYLLLRSPTDVLVYIQ